MTCLKETANPSSEKTTTVARVIVLKGMPIRKTLVGSLLQPRDHRDTSGDTVTPVVYIQYGAVRVRPKNGSRFII